MMHQTKSSLWKRFVAIAQPYLFPAISGAGWSTLLLLIMLMVFLFSVLLMFEAGIILTANHFAPVLTVKIASGLTELVKGQLRLYSGLCGAVNPLYQCWPSQNASELSRLRARAAGRDRWRILPVRKYRDAVAAPST